MALIRWSPFGELADIRREMQSLAGLMGSRFLPSTAEERFIPAMDVTTRGDDLLIKLELPAVDIENDVDISVEHGMLSISGKRSDERTEDREGYYMREMRYGSFQRDFPLPEGVNADAVSAEYKDGVLDVTIAGGAKQMERPAAHHIRITRGPGLDGRAEQGEIQGEGHEQAEGQAAQSQSGAAPESWAPAGTGSASSGESTGQDPAGER